MDLKSLQSHLKKEVQDSLYMVAGEDYYLKNEAENSIKAKYMSSKFDADFSSYTAPTMSYEDCLDSMQNFSFFSNLKFIHIRDVEKAPTSFLDKIADFYENGNLNGLVLLLSFVKIDKRKKAIKTLSKNAVNVEVKTPYENQVEGWARFIASQNKLKITSEALSHLAFLVGPSLIEISKAATKLKDLFGDEQVQREDVQDLISKIGEEDVFKICDLIGGGDLSLALLGLENAAKNGASYIGAMSLFHRHFKILMGILKAQQEAALKKQGVSQKDLASKVGVPPFFLSNYIRQSRLWNLQKLEEVFEALESADSALKSTRLKDSTVMSGFFMEISRILAGRSGLRTLSDSMELY